MEKLYNKAFEAYQKSYSPYSNFKVGAALQMKDGSLIGGTNVENASYGLCNCAERSALFAAYSKGYRKDDIEKMLVLASTPRPISPCGACRQVMSELIGENIEIILTNLNKNVKIVTIKDLLPYSFNSEDLDE